MVFLSSFICSFILSVSFAFNVLRVVTLYCIFSCATKWYLFTIFFFLPVHCTWFFSVLIFYVTLHSQDLALSEKTDFALIVALESE